MENIKKILYLLFVPMLLITACQDDDHELGEMLTKSEIDFEVVQDYAIDEGGNTVILKNLTPETVAMWDYGTGRSSRRVDTIRFAFKGEYTIKFSALTAGGVVEMEPVVVEVTENNVSYVNDPLWTLLTGGIGKSKTWILDNGKYGFATGPLSYADPSREQVWGNYEPNYEPGDVGQTEADMNAEMTFSLTGGPFLETVKPNEDGGNESGTFSLNAAAHTLSTTDATIIRPAGFIQNASNWTQNLNILELTENQLRIAVFRTNEEGPWWYILNYVSKEYAENYIPEEEEDPNFNHGNQLEILAGNSTRTWSLDLQVPYNWTDLEGNFLNDWNSRADIMATGWAPYGDGDVQNIDNATISFSADSTVTVTQDDGNFQTGTYIIDESTNMITFSGITPSIPIAGWVSTATTAENQWKIVIVERTTTGEAIGIWLGQRSTEKDEYMVFHFIKR